MAKVRIAINGFGRIGRLVYRIATGKFAEQFEVVCIHDICDLEAMVHLLKYDTCFGRIEGTLELKGDKMIHNGHEVLLIKSFESPRQLPWKKLDVDVVIESTGVFRTKKTEKKDGFDGHLEAGAKKVLLTVPAKDPIDATIVLGVNDGELKKEDQCISNASCTTNCLAPVIKVLNDNYKIKSGLMTTVHAYTNDQKVQDINHSDLRRARAAAMNIIPTSTGAAKAIGTIIPELNNKLNGCALRVPVITGSLVDLTVEVEKATTAKEINAEMKKAAETNLKGILEYTEDPIVSSDVIGNPHSSIFDSKMTMVMGNTVKIMSWYDNEWGYSNRVCELILNSMKL